MSDATLIEALLSDGHDVPVLLVEKGRIKRVNAASRTELGEGAAIGALVVDLLEETSRSKFEAALTQPGIHDLELQTIRSGCEPLALNILTIPSEGRHVLIARKREAYHAGDAARRMLELNSDLVDRTRELARRAAELDAAHRQLTRMGEVREQFIAMLSHDLRSPLSAVLLTASLLERGTVTSPEEIARRAALIHRNVDLVLHIVDGLLDAAHLHDDAFEIAPEIVCLDSVARAVAETLAPIALEAGVEIAVEVNDGPVRVRGDDLLLQRVVTNLVANAIRYAPHGSVVSIAMAGDSSRVRCSVSDEGPGVAPEVRMNLFERYRQGGGRAGKAGLGLFIARRILELHGGVLSLETPSRSRGATFVITLPALGAAPFERPCPAGPS